MFCLKSICNIKWINNSTISTYRKQIAALVTTKYLNILYLHAYARRHSIWIWSRRRWYSVHLPYTVFMGKFTVFIWTLTLHSYFALILKSNRFLNHMHFPSNLLANLLWLSPWYTTSHSRLPLCPANVENETFEYIFQRNVHNENWYALCSNNFALLFFTLFIEIKLSKNKAAAF